MKKIVFLYPDSTRELRLYDDLKSLDQVHLIGIRRKVVFTNESPDLKRRKIIDIVLQALGKLKRTIINSCYLNNLKLYFLPYFCEKANILFIMDWALLNMDNLNILDKCRKKNKDLKIYLYLINQIGCGDADYRKNVSHFKNKMNSFRWDCIFSFDESDCEKFGFHYMGFNYYSKKDMKPVEHPEHDVFFTACFSKLREKMICDVYNYFTSAHLKCDFHIKLWKQGYDMMVEGIHYMTDGVEMMSYNECLEKTMNSKCILEIIRPGQCAPTLRYFEAVCYNKKLLTNNPKIIDFPYYNPRYMKIFNSVEDIDLEWLKDDTPVNYHYKGEFSPINMIDYILNFG